MKKMYIAPEVKLIGFEASEKIAADKVLGFGSLDITLEGQSIITPSGGDIKFPTSNT